MKGPGLLGFMIPLRPDLGLHDVNTPRSNMVRLLADRRLNQVAVPESQRPGPILDVLDEDQREALLLSMAMTICRAEYHERRFWAIVQHLAERRLSIGGPVAFDAVAPSVIFEVAAALGAARTIVDEIIHIAARRTGGKNWEASKVINDATLAATVPEVRELQKRSPWFNVLNKYRNVLYHRGWFGDGGAYFPPDASEPEASDPERNRLLMPDFDSLKGDARAHQWTYGDRQHLEVVVRESLDGMRDFIDAVCIDVWEGKIPEPGVMKSEEQPNVVVTPPRPAPLLDGQEIYLPVFSSQTGARSFRSAYPTTASLDLATLPLLKTLFPEPGYAVSIAGLEDSVEAGMNLTVLIDPVGFAPVRARIVVPVAPSLTETRPFLDPIGLPKAATGAEHLFCWRQTR